MLCKRAISITLLAGSCFLAALSAESFAQKTSNGNAERFYRGLKSRGLMTLMQAYLKRKGDSISPANQVDMAKTYSTSAAETKDSAQKEKLFEKSQSFYLSAIKSADKQVHAIKELTSKKRSKLRMDLLQWKLELADMIFGKWASEQRNLMEITDRQQGDREKLIKMVGNSLKHYREALQDLDQWLSVMDRSADFDEAFDNPMFYRDALRLQRRSRYTMAWVTYYYAYVLPDNFKPAEGQRSRGELLETALTLIMEHATIANDTLVRKWWASLLVGLCHREKKEYEDAVKWLGDVDNKNSPEELRVRTRFELALTMMRQKRYIEALRMAGDLERAYSKNPKFEQNLYVIALPLLRVNILLRQSKDQNDAALKDKAMAILESLKARGDPWPKIVRDTIRKSGSGTFDAGKASPDELWAEAEAVREDARELKEKDQNAAITAFEKAVKYTHLYLLKAKPGHTSYDTALYDLGLIHLQLKDLKPDEEMQHLKEATRAFGQVVTETPASKYAADAAHKHTQILVQIYWETDADNDRTKCRDALQWYLKKYPTNEPGLWFYLGVALYRGGEFGEAGKAFGRTPEGLDKTVDAHYRQALSYREDLLKKAREKAGRRTIDAASTKATGALLGFAKYAAAITTKEKRAEWADLAVESRIMAAQLLSMDAVASGRDVYYKQALDILAALRKIKVPPRLMGQLLQVEITVLQRLKRFDEAMARLEKVFKELPPRESAGVVRGLFDAIINNVKKLLKNGQVEQAKVKVKGAEQVGSQFITFLDKQDTPGDRDLKEQILLELARVHLSAGQFEKALEEFKKLSGGMTAQEMREQESLDIERAQGMATCYETLGDKLKTEGEDKDAKTNFTQARDIWQLLFSIYEMRKGQDAILRAWEIRYHVFYCRHKLGDTNVKSTLKNLKIIGGGRLPIKDPELREKYRQLERLLKGAP